MIYAERNDIYAEATNMQNGWQSACLACIKTRIPTHHGYVDVAPKWLQILHGKIINSFFTTKMVAVSSKSALVASSIELVRPEKIHIISNGVKLPFKLKEEKLEDVRKILADWNPKKVVISVGRLVPQKGYSELIEVASEIIKIYEHTHFIVLGDGPDKKELIALIKKYNIEENVHLLGIRNDVMEWMHLSDIYLLTSLWEGLSLAMLEAMAIGLPVIASNSSIPDRMILNNENGVLVPDKNIKLYVEAIKSIFDNPELGEKIAGNATQLIKNNYSFELMSRRYLELFLNC